MMQWWSQISVRERIILSVALLIALLIVIDSVLVGPYQLHREQLGEQIDQSRSDLAWMKQTSYRLTSTKQANKQDVSGSLVSFINQQITRYKLKQKMQQMTPIKDSAVRLRLSDVEFDNLLIFLRSIEETSLLIDEIRLLPADAEGIVSVSMIIAKP